MLRYAWRVTPPPPPPPPPHTHTHNSCVSLHRPPSCPMSHARRCRRCCRPPTAGCSPARAAGSGGSTAGTRSCPTAAAGWSRRSCSTASGHTQRRAALLRAPPCKPGTRRRRGRPPPSDVGSRTAPSPSACRAARQRASRRTLRCARPPPTRQQVHASPLRAAAAPPQACARGASWWCTT